MISNGLRRHERDVQELLTTIFQKRVNAWPSQADSEFEKSFLNISSAHGVQPLLHYYLNQTSDWQTWPDHIRETITGETQFQGVQQLLRKLELENVLETLYQKGVEAILMKGMPLSYSIYPYPHLRPFLDIDLFIKQADVLIIKDIMLALGYEIPNAVTGDFISHQFTVIKKDEYKIRYAYDFHWMISNPALFSSMLSFDEAYENAIHVPELGKHARTLNLAHALLLACVHRVAHHHNDEYLIWLYDIHLLVEKMKAEEVKAFILLAKNKRVASICSEGIRLAQERFNTMLANNILRELAIKDGLPEPSAAYLGSIRQQPIDYFVLNWKALPNLTSKLKLLREYLFPDANYMFKKYSPSSYLLLPVFYAYRAFSGLLKFFGIVNRK